jgi:hypothetical protein
MTDFFYGRIDHVLCALILVSRIGDIGTTYLATPTLALEANPIVRKLGWPFALVTLAICLVPYVSLSVGVMVLVPSLMVSASNAGKIWMARTLGEQQFQALLLRLAMASRLRFALACQLASSFFIVLLGAVIVLLYPDGAEDYGYWVGAGVIAYGLVLALHGSTGLVRLFKKARAMSGAMTR